MLPPRRPIVSHSGLEAAGSAGYAVNGLPPQSASGSNAKTACERPQTVCLPVHPLQARRPEASWIGRYVGPQESQKRQYGVTMSRRAWVLSLYWVLLFAAVGRAQAADADALECFKQEYPTAFRHQSEVYLNGTYLVHIYHPHLDEAHRQDLMRVLARWPLVRIDVLDPSNPSIVKGSRLVSHQSEYGIRRLKGITGTGSYVLTRQIRVPWPRSDTWQGNVANRLAQHAVNLGWLPFVPLSFIGISLEEWLLRSSEVRGLRAAWTEIYGYKAVRVDAELNVGPPQVRFWFVPELGWVPVRWEWGYMEAPQNGRWKWVARLFYGDQVRGVGIATAGKCAMVVPDRPPDWEPMIWEAEILSYNPEPPPKREFTLAAFGIPAPPQEPSRSRLWLWTLIGALGTLTVLFLLRLSRTGRREKQGSA